MTTTTTDPLASKLAYLTRVLKTPTIGRTWETLADQARTHNWSHEEYLGALPPVCGHGVDYAAFASVAV